MSVQLTRSPQGAPKQPNRPPRRPPRKLLRGLIAMGRNTWRQLTSMRTALILLFLLAVAAVPGALLPQWSLSRFATQQYINDHPTLGPLLDRLGFFAVFASPWFAAIYLLLCISLVGCVTPRIRELITQLIRPPVACPRNLRRLPHHTDIEVAGEPVAVAERISAGLGRGVLRWRRVTRVEADGSVTVSAEKGYLREVGNLLFHLALLGLLASFAVGKLVGYEGTVLVTAGENQGYCNSSPIVYDDFRPGALVDGTRLAPFCIDLDTFNATYTPAGQADSFRAGIRYQAGADAGTDRWHKTTLRVNDPLRLPSGDRVYLLGHGFTPLFRVVFPGGQVRDFAQPFEPTDSMFTSQGAVKITDPPGYTGGQLLKQQLAIVGIFAPSAVVQNGIMSSAFPAALNPGVAIQIYRGDLGMASGRPQSVFAIDTNQVATGALVEVDSGNLSVGQSLTLDDGTTVTFTGFREFASLQTSYDPAQGYALLFVIALILGLMMSLGIKRRRIWYRINAVPTDPPPGAATDDDHIAASAASPRCRVQVGGLARTDQAGYGGEFAAIAALAQTKSDTEPGETSRQEGTTT